MHDAIINFYFCKKSNFKPLSYYYFRLLILFDRLLYFYNRLLYKIFKKKFKILNVSISII